LSGQLRLVQAEAGALKLNNDCTPQGFSPSRPMPVDWNIVFPIPHPTPQALHALGRNVSLGTIAYLILRAAS